ncbi:N-acyl homoserine lactonase family protein [Poseidonibacter lekithochrous]|uniref:N-acyl homoserine lactonase family protein n=1 Tax=Poseidonibacter TaxID=2321187 RepID=UPI001C08A545|nr:MULTISPECIES: N-acyl homoserine lactonase family protein [Poseidonibacter]MBU3015830.1 N-acyl homoserine lactonase family protein [Poseidonibacter lekithochrous]MDO6829129.1 N-acyl homoserine lactonase family protein [Poseidonibacter sp. 1_MG-2023]
MTQVKKFWPILTGTHRYEKTLSTRNIGHGVIIEAPILAYLIETKNGRILYDVGCDYKKIKDIEKRKNFYEHDGFPFGPPSMTKEQHLPNRLSQLGLQSKDIDIVICSHLHFDHAGGLCEVCNAEIHVHKKELEAAKALSDEAYFKEDFMGSYNWKVFDSDYDLISGVRAIETPGHTAGHMSLLIELPKGKPILLAGDAADLSENIEKEIAPGLCWKNDESMAIQSIKKLKKLALETGAEIWPNHDMSFFESKNCFPKYLS